MAMDFSIFPRIRAWSERVGGWDLRQYAYNNIDIADVAVIGAVFCPGFIEMDGVVFVDFLFHEESYAHWRTKIGGDNQAIERLLNHLHLWDVFDPKSEEDYSALPELCNKIGNMWNASARNAFPDREFSVELSDDPEDYGPTITICSKSVIQRL
jgi:hypothetical protein